MARLGKHTPDRLKQRSQVAIGKGAKHVDDALMLLVLALQSQGYLYGPPYALTDSDRSGIVVSQRSHIAKLVLCKAVGTTYNETNGDELYK